MAIADEKRGFYGVQFHPEVNHTEHGTDMIRNFLYEVCKAKGDWTMGDYLQVHRAGRLKEQVGPDGRVLLALSGGVDSSVLAALLAEAVGERLTCVFVDHGLMRKDEGDEVEAAFSKWNVNFVRVNAEERFLSKLAGVERSRARSARSSVRSSSVCFEDEAKKHRHHRVGLPGSGHHLSRRDRVRRGRRRRHQEPPQRKRPARLGRGHFKDDASSRCGLLFKDEVRQLGRELGLPEYLVMRQPFPGPGLAIRIIGAVTKEKADTLREADFIYRDEIAKAGWDKQISQYFAVLTNMPLRGRHGRRPHL